MRLDEFKKFLKMELQREAEEELAKVEANEELRNLKMPEDMKREIWESLLREIEKREKNKSTDNGVKRSR